MEVVATPKQERGTLDLVYARATLYGALALGFRPPTAETVSRLLAPDCIEMLADAAGELADEVHNQVVRLRTLEPPSLHALTLSYQRLFGHTARGVVAPYETEYGDEALFQQPHEMGDLAGFYRAFGLTLNPTVRERLDHVSCECEFMLFLALKEAYARECADTAMAEATCQASRLFLRDHLGRFGLAFARQVARADQGGFYGALAELCFTFLTRECARVGVPAGPVTLGLRPLADDRVPMACGSGTACAALAGTCGTADREA
jgi:TorA maturation chaperone TorD